MGRDVIVTAETRNINSKKLLGIVKSTVFDVCDEYITIHHAAGTRTYDYTQLAMFADLFMEDLFDKGLIMQHDVICDERNNDDIAVRNGHICLDIRYRQAHCVNVSRVKFHIQIVR
jgi:hypothetical protein